MIRLIRELGGPGGYEIDANWLPLTFRAIMKRRPWWKFYPLLKYREAKGT